MKWIFSLILGLLVSPGFAQEADNLFDVRVTVTPVNDQYLINASYVVPTSLCSAFASITDYEASNIPGVIESKVLSRSGNKVRVARVIDQEVLFFHLQMRSQMEYTEIPNKMLQFEQISGDAKMYKGTWKLSPNQEKILFTYQAMLEPHFLAPPAVIEYYMKNNIQDQFMHMAERAAHRKSVDSVACLNGHWKYLTF